MQAPSPSALPSPGGRVLSPRGTRYLVGRQLGTGSFGSVFECIGPFDQLYALKVLQPAANRSYAQVREEWQHEAQRLYRLRHPNIVYVHDVFEAEALFYLVLERLDHSLEDMLGQPFTDRLTIELSRQLLFALQYLHDNDVVHNDVHAGNVLVAQGDRLTLKFSDFGIAQELYGREAVRPRLVNNRIIVPEAARYGYTTAQGDLYQLGLLMFHMHTGEPALDPSSSYEQILEQVTAGVPRARAQALATPLGDVISVLLRRHEQYRFHNPAMVWEELRKLDGWTSAVSAATHASLWPAVGAPTPLPAAPPAPPEPTPITERTPTGQPVRSGQTERPPASVSRSPETAPLTPRTSSLAPGDEPAPRTPRLG